VGGSSLTTAVGLWEESGKSLSRGYNGVVLLLLEGPIPALGLTGGKGGCLIQSLVLDGACYGASALLLTSACLLTWAKEESRLLDGCLGTAAGSEGKATTA
jgi:hypothetical protein